MSIEKQRQISTIIVNLSDVVIRGIDDALMAKLSSAHGIKFSPVRESAFCAPECLDVFAKAAEGIRSGDEYLESVIAVGNWEISLEALRKEIMENLRHELPGMKKLLLDLRRDGFCLVLESTHIREWIDDAKVYHGFLDEVFDYQSFSFETGRPIKDSEAFSELVDQLSKEASECIYIGNSLRSCQAASDAGMQVIEFHDADSLRRSLSELGLI